MVELSCDVGDWVASGYCVATYVLVAVVVILVLLFTVAIGCSVCLCCKAYRFRFTRCSCKVIHCLCCSCEIKEAQPEQGAPPTAEGLTRSDASSGHYERVVVHAEAPRSHRNQRPEPLPRPLSPARASLPTHTGDTEDSDDEPKARTVSVDNNYIEIVEPDTRTSGATASNAVKQSSTDKKQVTKEEVQPFGFERLSAPDEDDDVPLLGHPVNKGGYKSTEYLQSQPTRTLPTATGSSLPHKRARVLNQREAHDHVAGHTSLLQSSDAASSDDTCSSNPAAVHPLNRSSPA